MRKRQLTGSPAAVAFGLLLLALAACAGGDPNSPMAQESNEAAIENESADDVLLESDR
jgi:hypothetical protein